MTGARSRGVLVVGLVAAAAVALGGCSGGDAADPVAGGTSVPAGGTASAGDPSTTASPGPSTALPSSGPASSGSPTSSAPPAGPGAAGSTDATRTVPAISRTTLAPAPPRATTRFGRGLAARVTSTRAVTVTGRGPGEVSGPALAVTLTFTNSGTADLPLDAVTVSAAAGGQELSPSDSEPASPVSGRLRPGASASGVYVFVRGSGRAVPLALTVSPAPDLPVVVITPVG